MATSKTPKKKAVPPKPAAPRDNIDLLDDMPVMVQMILGGTRKTMGAIADIGDQSLIELDKEVGRSRRTYSSTANTFARGEVPSRSMRTSACDSPRFWDRSERGGPNVNHR